MRLLVTRPDPDAERTAAALRALGHDVLNAPLLNIEPVEAADLDPARYAAVVITSANAPRAIAHHPHRTALAALQVFAVGRHTADAAVAVGFTDVVSAEGDVEELSRLIATRCPRGASLLYLAGEDRTGDLAADLAREGIDVQTVVVYRVVPVSAFPPPLVDALKHDALDGVVHYSRRTAVTYLRCAQAAGLLIPALAPIQCCLSRKVADPLIIAGANRVEFPRLPTETALLDIVGRL